MDKNKPTKAFKEVIEKFDHIGNCYYNGKHHDNVLNIFNDLEENDRRELLRGVYAIYSVIENGIIKLEDSSGPRTEIPRSDLSIGEINEKSLVELKFWFIKMLLIISLLGMIILIVLVLYFSSTVEQGAGTLSKMFKILGMLMR